MIYYTADLHFCHSNIIRLCNRPFDSVEEMNRTLIFNWNARVQHSDTVVCVGDFGYENARGEVRHIFDQLNGQKILVIGNHDCKRILRFPWSRLPVDRLKMTDQNTRLVIDHYALRTWPGFFRGTIHLYGHSHGHMPGYGNSLDVGVDVWDYRPICLNEIKDRIAKHSPVRLVTGEVGEVHQ